jgi:hypothetical protein
MKPEEVIELQDGVREFVGQWLAKRNPAPPGSKVLVEVTFRPAPPVLVGVRVGGNRAGKRTKQTYKELTESDWEEILGLRWRLTTNQFLRDLQSIGNTPILGSVIQHSFSFGAAQAIGMNAKFKQCRLPYRLLTTTPYARGGNFWNQSHKLYICE